MVHAPEQMDVDDSRNPPGEFRNRFGAKQKLPGFLIPGSPDKILPPNLTFETLWDRSKPQ